MGEPGDNGTRRLLLLPYLAQGHLIPFMELAKLLHRRVGPCTSITIVTTPLNARRLRSAIPAASAIGVAELHFSPVDHGLPPGCENTNSAPPHLAPVLLQASTSLRPAFHSLVEEFCRSDGRPPLCIVSDTIMSWSVHTARAFGTFHAVFHVFGAFASVLSGFVLSQFPIKRYPVEHVFTVPDFSGISVDRTQIFEAFRNAEEDDPWLITMTNLICLTKDSDGALINTVEELEAKALDHLRRNSYKKVWAVGPLLASPSPRTMQASDQNPTIVISQWLNSHPPKSVLYVSFGSEQTLLPWQMMELAKGLEQSGKAFIWVVRPPTGFDIDAEFRADWLPEGFEGRVTSRESNRGLLLKGWAPQVEILSHESTGGFLTHCGWNSTMESIMHGVPIVSWPLAFEQCYTSKQLEEELEVGVEMARQKGAVIDAATVARIVSVVIDGGSGRGEELRRKARILAELMRAATVEEDSHKGSSVRAIDDFIEEMLRTPKSE